MTEGVFIRMLYGASLSLHNFFANLPLGLAFIQVVFAARQFKKGNSDVSDVKLVFDILVLSIILSVVSGFALEIEFSRFWPTFNFALEEWNQHLGHKSAVLSFFATSILITIIYRFNLHHYPVLYLALSLGMVILAWLFSIWGIFLNTVMQFPMGGANQDGVLVLSGSILEYFFSGYHMVRQSHIAAASLLKASILLLLIFGYIERKLLFRYVRQMLSLMMIGLIILGITGHLQAVNISKLQPAKFSAMEGIFIPNDTSVWNVLGYMEMDQTVNSISIPGGLQKMTKESLVSLQDIPSEDHPNVFLVFNSFKSMLLSFLLIVVTTLSLLIYPLKVKIYMLYILFFFSELALNSGWLLSEAGRQPWLFFGLMRRISGVGLEYTGYSAVNLFLQISLLLLIAAFGCRYVKHIFINGGSS